MTEHYEERQPPQTITDGFPDETGKEPSGALSQVTVLHMEMAPYRNRQIHSEGNNQEWEESAYRMGESLPAILLTKD